MSERTRWPAVVAAIATGVVAAAYVGKLPPALPALTDEFGLSLVAAGWVVSMFNVIATGTAILFGVAADRAGAFRACVAGLVLLAIGGTGGALAPGTVGLMASRVVEGIGFITVSVSAAALVFTATAAEDRKLALGVWSAYLPFGFALTVLAAPPLLAAVGWRGLWLAIVAVTAACGVWLAAERHHYALPPAGVRSIATIAAALRQPGPWWVAAAMGCYTAQWSSVMVWLPTFLVQERSYSVLGASLATALAVLVNVPGNLTGTWLLQRRAERGRIIAAGAAMMGVCGVVGVAAPLPDALRYLACLLLSYAGGIIPPAVLSSTQAYARSGAQVASLQGLIMQGSNLGQFVGPVAIAALVSATGDWANAAWVLGAAAACGAACGRIVRRIERHRAAAA
ncbi:MAG TPA: MFS transporter [Burkholderiales bacterium]|nr:MFS transporter [Burkholderiales bacterium]